jgi:23S rRNA pseudouridine1911/1915/1917 synthase
MVEIGNSPLILDFTPGDDEIGARLDKAITKRLASFSRVKIQQLIKDGRARVNGKVAKAALRLEAGDHVVVEVVGEIVAPDNSAATVPQAVPLDVLYEDEDLAAIHKPAGMVVHPAAGHAGGTLVNALLARWPQVAQVGGEGRAGIVHRLDKDTSGVIVIAKTEPARLHLMAQFARRTIRKRYLALVDGQPKTEVGEINAPIDRDPQQRKKMTVVRGGREALTFFRVLEVYHVKDRTYTLIECLPKTGRTHQIRVHLAFIGHPIVGDVVYGRRKPSLPVKRHFLHAESITLQRRGDEPPLTISAPVPPDLAAVLDGLRSERPVP